MKMDTGWLIIAFLGTVIATTAAISLIRQSIADRSSGLSDNTLAEMERSNRLHHVDRQIWELVDDLTITWPQTELPEDWKTKCKATLRAILKPEIVDDFDKCLKTQFPRESARAFLRALAGSLTLADLRSGA